MKLAVVLAVAGLAAAQIPGIPDCAQKCLADAIVKAGCKVDDPACSCQPDKQAAIRGDSAFLACITGGCSAEDLGKAISGGAAICENLPPAGGSSSAPPASSSAPPASSQAPSTTAPPTSKPTNGTSSTTKPPPVSTAGAAAGPVVAGAAAFAMLLAL